MSTCRSRLLAARLTREAHVAAFGGSGQTQTQAQYCRDRGLNATTLSGWLRIARVAASATAITLTPSAAAQGHEPDGRAQIAPDTVVRKAVHASGPLTALAVRIEAAMTASTSPSTSTSHATTNSHATAHTDSAATRPTLTVRGLGGWRILTSTLQRPPVPPWPHCCTRLIAPKRRPSRRQRLSRTDIESLIDLERTRTHLQRGHRLERGASRRTGRAGHDPTQSADLSHR